jgi:hypothetical protein
MRENPAGRRRSVHRLKTGGLRPPFGGVVIASGVRPRKWRLPTQSPITTWVCDEVRHSHQPNEPRSWDSPKRPKVNPVDTFLAPYEQEYQQVPALLPLKRDSPGFVVVLRDLHQHEVVVKFFPETGV